MERHWPKGTELPYTKALQHLIVTSWIYWNFCSIPFNSFFFEDYKTCAFSSYHFETESYTVVPAGFNWTCSNPPAPASQVWGLQLWDTALREMYLIFHSLLRASALQVPHAFSFMVEKSVTFSYLYTLKTVKYNNFHFQSANIILRTSEQNIPLVQTFAISAELVLSWCSGFSLGTFSFCLNYFP